MLTLYYSPGACSLAVHIALNEQQLKYNKQKVDLKTKKTADDLDFFAINPKGYVPVLTLESGQMLTEAAAILFYIADQGSQPAVNNPDPFAKYRLQEALTFVSSELHKKIGAFFDPKLPEEYKSPISKKISERLDYMNNLLEKQQYLAGDQFTVADAYCFAVLRWLNFLDTGLKLGSWPYVDAYFTKLENRPSVRQSLQEEGLLKD